MILLPIMSDKLLTLLTIPENNMNYLLLYVSTVHLQRLLANNTSNWNYTKQNFLTDFLNFSTSWYPYIAALHIAKRNSKPDELSLVFQEGGLSIYFFIYQAVFSEEFQLQIPKASSIPLQFNPAALATKAG